jgi:peptide/nickel transport system substrate-binding protein
MKSRIRKTVFAVVFLVISLSIIPQSVNAQVRVSVGVTETMETFNPYGDTVSLMFGVWCQVMGCLGTFDFVKGEYVGILAERWEVKDPNNWVFYLRKNVKFHDGSPLTAADVVHSFNRMKNDSQSKQIQYAAPIASVTAINSHTVRFTTHKPTAPLLEYLFDRFAITSKAIYDKHGSRRSEVPFRRQGHYHRDSS